MHTSCYYATLFHNLQRAVLKLSFLAKPCHPNGHDDQMALVDPLEGYELYTPTTHGHSWHDPNHGPAHDHYHNYNHSPDSDGLCSHDPDLGP